MLKFERREDIDSLPTKEVLKKLAKLEGTEDDERRAQAPDTSSGTRQEYVMTIRKDYGLVHSN